MLVRKVNRRTLAFLIFMGIYFINTIFFTYYSKVVYVRMLPVVETVMPEGTGERHNGRLIYKVPEQSIHTASDGGSFILTARYQTDLMGEQYCIKRIDVWVLERENGVAVVDGIVREEPIVLSSDKEYWIGSVVRLK